MNKIIFYVNKFAFLKKDETFELPFVDKNLKRRLSPFARQIFWTLNECYDENIENIVFASKYGQTDKVNQLIEQYQTNNEVSPLLFVNSLHSSIVGLFSNLKQYSKNYSALSADTSTISNGFLSAVISKSSNTLFCWGDMNCSEYCSFSVSISKTKGKKCALYLDKNKKAKPNPEEFISFFKGEENKLETSLYYLEAI